MADKGPRLRASMLVVINNEMIGASTSRYLKLSNVFSGGFVIHTFIY